MGFKSLVRQRGLNVSNREGVSWQNRPSAKIDTVSQVGCPFSGLNSPLRIYRSKGGAKCFEELTPHFYQSRRLQLWAPAPVRSLTIDVWISILEFSLGLPSTSRTSIFSPRRPTTVMLL